ncbi:MAG: hypothetical protein U9R23_03725 [Candidatus Cloacimonadota bacterium]|nr:hypothetical protein [Candidatus Cloacimonadota bacterium]
MVEEIKVGEIVKDICGDVGEVIDIEHTDNEKVWRYILADYDEDGRHTWPSHPDYTRNLY